MSHLFHRVSFMIGSVGYSRQTEVAREYVLSITGNVNVWNVAVIVRHFQRSNLEGWQCVTVFQSLYNINIYIIYPTKISSGMTHEFCLKITWHKHTSISVEFCRQITLHKYTSSSVEFRRQITWHKHASISVEFCLQFSVDLAVSCHSPFLGK
jgi:hypothetical protein